ncbi:MAG: citramalate synthase [SAR202 cluster bacterium]|nr:citramalate synthase [SAR202 cluster bacterium]
MEFAWPLIEYREEGMREGMQIESAAISVDDKVRLLNALGETGLKHIVAGSFVSPKYTPQMAKIEEVLERFTPKPGVKYTALLVNEMSYERARRFVPPLTIEDDRPTLNVHLCDVFVRRNFNRSQALELESWPKTVAKAKERGVKEAAIAVAAAWGSNFTGEFTLPQRMDMLERAHALWDEAGIPVTQFSAYDPMAWTTPHRVEEQIYAIRGRWPHITRFYLHLHDARGMALVSAYAAMRALGKQGVPGYGVQGTRDGGTSEQPTPSPYGQGPVGLSLRERNKSEQTSAVPHHPAPSTQHPSSRAPNPVPCTLILDGTIGGIGGCPYCGTGRATGMMATEDFVHMLEGMGIPTGVDMDRLIDVVWMLEEVIGRPAFGSVSKAGPRPRTPDRWFDPNMPFVETLEQAKHFKLGPGVYKDGIYPWKEPIRRQ